MRLIDADALLEAMRADYCADCDRRKGIMKNGKEGFVYDIGDAPCRACSIDDTINDVEYAPTIDAISVEWLRKKREVAIWQFAGAIDWLLSDWQKEQEAQDG